MTDINETVSTVLRLDAEATPGPWNHRHRWGNIFDESSDPPFSCRRGETRREDDGAAIVGADNVEVVYEGTFEPYEQTAGVLGALPADAILIAYYRTSAPVLAREVRRLQGEVERLRVERKMVQRALESANRNLFYASKETKDACVKQDELRREIRYLEAEVYRLKSMLEVTHD